MINLFAVITIVGFICITAHVITKNNDMNEKIREVEDWIERNKTNNI